MAKKRKITMARWYSVTLQITGHAHITVKAEDEESAIREAIDEITINDIESWEPSPWHADVEEIETSD